MSGKPPILRTAIYAGGFFGLVTVVYLAFSNYTLGTDRQWYLTDMFDSQSIKPWEAPMATLPDGVVSRNRHVANYNRYSAEGRALTNPYAADEASLATGKWAYGVYCTPCHGAEGLGGGPVTDMTDGKKRFMAPGPPLAGGMNKVYPDGHLYLTIRNGGAIMPAYGWAMTDTELWALVSYLRTMPDSTYVDPAAAAGAQE